MWIYIDNVYSREWWPADDIPGNGQSPLDNCLTQLGSIEHLSMKWGTIVGMIQDETNNNFSLREETRINVSDASLETGGTMKNLEESRHLKEIVLNIMN